MQQNDREKYDAFFKNFGLQLKFGVYNDYGMHKDLLKDLLEFYSSTEKKPVTLKEYLGRMKEEQKFIYYACGDTVEKIDRGGDLLKIVVAHMRLLLGHGNLFRGHISHG